MKKITVIDPEVAEILACLEGKPRERDIKKGLGKLELVFFVTHFANKPTLVES